MNEIILQLVDTYKMVLTDEGYRLMKEITITEKGKELCRFTTDKLDVSAYELAKYYIKNGWENKYGTLNTRAD